MEKNMTCISCPMGCYLTLTIEAGEVKSVSGNSCKRGIVYAKAEYKNPLRVVTTTVGVRNSHHKVVPVKTQEAIPKDKIFQCLEALKGIEIDLPIHIGDVIVENVCQTGINVIATRGF